MRLRGDLGLPVGQSAHVDPLDILDCNEARLLTRRMVIDLTESNASLSAATQRQRPLPSAQEEPDYLCAYYNDRSRRGCLRHPRRRQDAAREQMRVQGSGIRRTH